MESWYVHHSQSWVVYGLWYQSHQDQDLIGTASYDGYVKVGQLGLGELGALDILDGSN